MIDELRKTLGNMEVALDSIEESLLWTDGQGKLQWCNAACAALVGRQRIMLLQKPVSEILPLVALQDMETLSEEKQAALAPSVHPLLQCLIDQSPVQGLYLHAPSDTMLRVEAVFIPASSAGIQEASAVLTARDVAGERELDSYRLRDAALHAAANAMVIMDVQGAVHWVNAAFTQMTGYSLEETRGRSLKVLKSGRQDKAFYRRLWETVLAGRPWQGELVNRRKSGELYHEHQTVTPIRNEQGEVAHFIVIKQDISEQTATKQALAQREAQLRAVFDSAVDAIVTADTSGNIVAVNPAAERIFGYAPGSLQGQNVRIFTPPEIREKHSSFMQRYLDTGERRILGIGREVEAMRQNGERFPIELSISEVKAGGAHLFTAIVRDISERKAQERAIRELNAELEQRVLSRTRSLQDKTAQLSKEVAERKEAEREVRSKQQLVQDILEGIGGAFFVLRKGDARLVELNAIASQLFGLDREKALGASCTELFAFMHGGEIEDICLAAADRPSYDECSILLPEGRQKPVARHVLPLEMHGEPHLAVLLFDISGRRALERKLAVAQKLESIGLLASGIAHEINTPVQYVGDSLRFIQEAFEDLLKLLAEYAGLKQECSGKGGFEKRLEALDELEEDIEVDFLEEEVPKACARALEGVNRVASIVLAMKKFSHPGGSEKKALDLNKALETTITVSRNEWKYAAEVETDLDPELPLVMGFAGDLNQVLLNLLVNAAHAIAEKHGDSPDKGRIRLVTRREGDQVVIEVNDSGTGIKPENRDRIFDPFFTTKEVGKGTGQGLAIVHDIVVGKHGGAIDVDSSPEGGARFTVRLPVSG